MSWSRRCYSSDLDIHMSTCAETAAIRGHVDTEREVENELAEARPKAECLIRQHHKARLNSTHLRPRRNVLDTAERLHGPSKQNDDLRIRLDDCFGAHWLVAICLSKHVIRTSESEKLIRVRARPRDCQGSEGRR